MAGRYGSRAGVAEGDQWAVAADVPSTSPAASPRGTSGTPRSTRANGSRATGKAGKGGQVVVEFRPESAAASAKHHSVNAANTPHRPGGGPRRGGGGGGRRGKAAATTSTYDSRGNGGGTVAFKARPAPSFEMPEAEPRVGRAQGLRRCGLCERTFASDNLPGLITRKAVVRLRDAWAEQFPDAVPGATTQSETLGLTSLQSAKNVAHSMKKKARSRRRGGVGFKRAPSTRHMPGGHSSDDDAGSDGERVLTDAERRLYKAALNPTHRPEVHYSRLYDKVQLCVFCAQFFNVDNAPDPMLPAADGSTVTHSAFVPAAPVAATIAGPAHKGKGGGGAAADPVARARREAAKAAQAAAAGDTRPLVRRRNGGASGGGAGDDAGGGGSGTGGAVGPRGHKREVVSVAPAGRAQVAALEKDASLGGYGMSADDEASRSSIINGKYVTVSAPGTGKGRSPSHAPGHANGTVPAGSGVGVGPGMLKRATSVRVRPGHVPEPVWETSSPNAGAQRRCGEIQRPKAPDEAGHGSEVLHGEGDGGGGEGGNGATHKAARASAARRSGSATNGSADTRGTKARGSGGDVSELAATVDDDTERALFALRLEADTSVASEASTQSRTHTVPALPRERGAGAFRQTAIRRYLREANTRLQSHIRDLEANMDASLEEQLFVSRTLSAQRRDQQRQKQRTQQMQEQRARVAAANARAQAQAPRRASVDSSGGDGAAARAGARGPPRAPLSARSAPDSRAHRSGAGGSGGGHGGGKAARRRPQSARVATSATHARGTTNGSSGRGAGAGGSGNDSGSGSGSGVTRRSGGRAQSAGVRRPRGASGYVADDSLGDVIESDEDGEGSDDDDGDGDGDGGGDGAGDGEDVVGEGDGGGGDGGSRVRGGKGVRSGSHSSRTRGGDTGGDAIRTFSFADFNARVPAPPSPTPYLIEYAADTGVRVRGLTVREAAAAAAAPPYGVDDGGGGSTSDGGVGDGDGLGYLPSASLADAPGDGVGHTQYAYTMRGGPGQGPGPGPMPGPMPMPLQVPPPAGLSSGTGSYGSGYNSHSRSSGGGGAAAHDGSPSHMFGHSHYYSHSSQQQHQHSRAHSSVTDGDDGEAFARRDPYRHARVYNAPAPVPAARRDDAFGLVPPGSGAGHGVSAGHSHVTHAGHSGARRGGGRRGSAGHGDANGSGSGNGDGNDSGMAEPKPTYLSLGVLGCCGGVGNDHGFAGCVVCGRMTQQFLDAERPKLLVT